MKNQRKNSKTILETIQGLGAEAMSIGRGLAVGLLLSSAPAHAEEAEGLTPHELKTIMYQSINVTLLIVGLIYFLRKPVLQALSEKKRSYEAAAERAKAALQAAEAERMEIHIRLTKLESTAQESLSRARAEAADMRNQMLKDANEYSARLQREAQATAQQEAEKAKESLRLHLILQSTTLAQEVLQKKITADDQTRLQGEFISNIQTVES